MTQVQEKPKRSKYKTAAVVITCLFVLWAIPAPFKPSLYGYVYTLMIKHSVKSSTDPVYLPSGELYDNTTFTTYIGWHNAYHITYNNPVEITVAANGYKSTLGPLNMYQLTPDSKTPEGMEGLSDYDLQVYKREMVRTDCAIVQDKQDLKLCDSECVSDPKVHICLTPRYEFLVRTVLNDNHKIYLIARPFGLTDRAIRIMESMQPVAVAEAAKTKLKPVY